MAVVPICYRMSYKDQPLLNSKEDRYNEKGFMCSFIATQEGCGCFSSISGETGRRWSNDATGIPLKVNARKGTRGSQGMVYTRGSTPFCLRSRSNKIPQRDKQCIVCHAYKSNSNEKQLQSLDTYFGKLQHDANKPSSVSLNKKEEFIDQDGQSKAKSVLGSLDDYFGKVSIDANSKNYVSSASNDETSEAASYSVRVGSGRGGWKKMKNYMRFKNKDGEDGSKHSYNETSDFHLISILVSINIAVFLFEIASPIQNSDLELFSLPLLYGAKINHLILFGKWWRLVTPMFLHSGILHVALGCWVLLSFGPRVCRAYGSFTFLLIYILGGIFGNLTSFLQTPDPIVGGTVSRVALFSFISWRVIYWRNIEIVSAASKWQTNGGPVFAVIGAWLIYQIQNKEVITKADSENMLQRAIIATAISCILSNFGPIDDKTHFGVGFTGILYGFLTCPMLRMDDGSSKSGQEEGITLVRQYADPCKSLIIFSLFLLVLSSFLFIVEPPLNSLAPNTFL